MGHKGTLREQAQRTKAAARSLAKCSSEIKNRALLAMAERLEQQTAFLLAENAKDLEAGKKKTLAPPLLERLTLTPKRIGEMSAGLREVAALPDPVGEVFKMTRRPNGIQVGQMRVPIGVIGIIYESRPNVTADAAGLCIKSGNGVILRGAPRRSTPISPSRISWRRQAVRPGFPRLRSPWSKPPTGRRFSSFLPSMTSSI
ncbi:MAG: hypothetical protein MPW15_04870 [Candidatus Manganitrophus sp.]|nr:hypothetical protein [Candidatus Manganitrophus sp.]